MTLRSFTIRVPATTANIGPGFDVLGISLGLYLTLTVTISPDASSDFEMTYIGEGADSVPLTPTTNLITKTALYVLDSVGISSFQHGLKIHVENHIPLGRGLGSSGAAVVAGVILGNEVGNLKLSKARMLDYCLMVERHPDNVAAALNGGFVASYLRELEPKDTAPRTIPLSESDNAGESVRSEPKRTPEPPSGIAHSVRLRINPAIKAVVVVPSFEVATAKARAVLPRSYEREDVVFNLQRVAILTNALGQDPLDVDLIFQAIQDKVHQPYRQTLIPGLSQILSSITPITHPGLLGICLSGAGPTILALATDGFDNIAECIVQGFKQRGIESWYKVLEIVEDGAVCAK